MIPQSNPKAGYLAHREDIDAAIQRVLESGWYILGQEVAAFEREFAAAQGRDWSVGVANGTDAIELALRALGVKAGDRVITVSHTAVATVAAIARIGAQPLFADIDPRRYTLDPTALDALLSTPEGRSARALVVVHLYGQLADMAAIMPIARRAGLAVVEDCAQAHGAALEGIGAGCWGDLGCFSFYPTKNLAALGDGGAIVGNDPDLAEHVRLLREYGWQKRYVSARFGLNSRLDELQAAILRARLPHLAADNNRRRAIAACYDEGLLDSRLSVPWRAPLGQHVFHQYVITDPDREDLREKLKALGIATLVHYPLAVHQQPAYVDPAFRPLPLPHTETAVKQILSLPIFPELPLNDAARVSAALCQLRPR
ncbi:MAG: DegT/DnrJ/EryC1/StrS family aminotransferase [Dechloromonas sp.]|nr:DegT/DnrJ/EryC1/StrS family aminotransferase [Dechloromonas sp.]